ncbi:RNA polymerase sigma factor [Planctomycetota bacterium]
MSCLCEQEIAASPPGAKDIKASFDTIVKKYMKDAYFIALGLVGNREDALDLSQEAFIRAYRNMNRFNPKWDFFPWFYQILKNLCFNHLRRQKERICRSLEAMGSQTVTPVEGDLFDPEMVAQRNELKDKVWQAIGRLDQKHREVIILRHFQNFSYTQMAETLFCSKGTVMSRLYYARKSLQEILKREGF